MQVSFIRKIYKSWQYINKINNILILIYMIFAVVTNSNTATYITFLFLNTN